MYGKVVNPLLGLLDEHVAVYLPSEVFGNSPHPFESLVQGNGTEGSGTVAYQPFAGVEYVGAS